MGSPTSSKITPLGSINLIAFIVDIYCESQLKWRKGDEEELLRDTYWEIISDVFAPGCNSLWTLL
jgi:hypothetical protein